MSKLIPIPVEWDNDLTEWLTTVGGLQPATNVNAIWWTTVIDRHNLQYLIENQY